MIVIFQSDASGDVIMFGDVAYKMMELMGKEPTAQGIVTVEQLPEALALLRAAVEAEKARLAGLGDEERPEFEQAPDGQKRPFVSLTQRAAPLIELLEWSLKKQKPVMWGL